MDSRLASIFAIVIIVAACSGGAPMSPSAVPSTASSAPPVAASGPSPVKLLVFAAASLGNALKAADSAYEASHPGVTIELSTDSSAALATQIQEGGAPADVFLSADTANPARLVTAGLTDGPAVDFAGNTLTVIVPSDDPAGITTPVGLAKPGVRIVAAGDDVPITKYANQLVANLTTLPGYPPDFEAAYRKNIATKEPNVSAVTTKIVEGVGDAAIVYATDARSVADKVREVPVPPEADVPATYAGVVVKAGTHPGPSRTYLEWIAGPDGRKVLARFGFTAPAA